VKPVYHRDNVGFWLTVCIALSALAGYLLLAAGVIHG
jgi:hypothetical protein